MPEDKTKKNEEHLNAFVFFKLVVYFLIVFIKWVV